MTLFDTLKSLLPTTCFIAGEDDLFADQKLTTYARNIRKHAGHIRATGRLNEGYAQASSALLHYAHMDFERADVMAERAIASLNGEIIT